jgi:tRNA(adenine34) deaminase
MPKEKKPGKAPAKSTRTKLDPDIKFMREALKEARRAYRNKEVPVGAVITRKGRIVSRGHNRVEEKSSVVAHAEVEALGEASRKLTNWRMTGCTIYSTVEPCAMCKGALIMARMDRLVFGAKNESLVSEGRFGGRELDSKGKLEIREGVCAEECSELMKEFFRRQRKEKKVEEN